MIYVTGDIHGGIDLRKLLDKRFRKLTKDDYILICGDFGLVYNWKRESGKEKKWLKWFEKMPWTTIFVDGNHECFPRLYSYPEVDFHGGKAHQIRSNIFHLMRGYIFEIEGNTFFTMGGAQSHDRGPVVGDTKQVQGRFWWPEEIPSEEEMQFGRENLAKVGNHVDYVITHCLPTHEQHWVRDDFKPDPITEYFEQLKKEITFTHWYCGHYHTDLDLGGNMTVLFNRVIELGETIVSSKPIAGSPIFSKQDKVIIWQNNKIMEGVITGLYPWGTGGIRDQAVYVVQVGDVRYKIIKEENVLGFAYDDE